MFDCIKCSLIELVNCVSAFSSSLFWSARSFRFRKEYQKAVQRRHEYCCRWLIVEMDFRMGKCFIFVDLIVHVKTMAMTRTTKSTQIQHVLLGRCCTVEPISRRQTSFEEDFHTIACVYSLQCLHWILTPYPPIFLMNELIMFTEPEGRMNMKSSFNATIAMNTIKEPLEILGNVPSYDCKDILYHCSNAIRTWFPCSGFKNKLSYCFPHHKKSLPSTVTSRLYYLIIL